MVNAAVKATMTRRSIRVSRTFFYLLENLCRQITRKVDKENNFVLTGAVLGYNNVGIFFLLGWARVVGGKSETNKWDHKSSGLKSFVFRFP